MPLQLVIEQNIFSLFYRFGSKELRFTNMLHQGESNNDSDAVSQEGGVLHHALRTVARERVQVHRQRRLQYVRGYGGGHILAHIVPGYGGAGAGGGHAFERAHLGPQGVRGIRVLGREERREMAREEGVKRGGRR